MLRKVRSLTARAFSARCKSPGRAGPRAPFNADAAAQTPLGPSTSADATAPVYHAPHDYHSHHRSNQYLDQRRPDYYTRLTPSTTRGSAQSVPELPGAAYSHPNASGALLPSEAAATRAPHPRRRSEPRTGRASASMATPVPAVPLHSASLPRRTRPSLDDSADRPLALALLRTDSPESLGECEGDLIGVDRSAPQPPAPRPRHGAPPLFCGSKQASSPWVSLPPPASASFNPAPAPAGQRDHDRERERERERDRDRGIQRQRQRQLPLEHERAAHIEPVLAPSRHAHALWANSIPASPAAVRTPPQPIIPSSIANTATTSAKPASAGSQYSVMSDDEVQVIGDRDNMVVFRAPIARS